MVWSFSRKANLNAALKLGFCQQQPAEPVHRHHQQLRTWSQWTPPSQTPRHLRLAWYSTLSGADHELRNRVYDIWDHLLTCVHVSWLTWDCPRVGRWWTWEAAEAASAALRTRTGRGYQSLQYYQYHLNRKKQFWEKDAFVTLSYVHADCHVSITKDVVIINILVVAIKSPSSSHVIAHCPLSHNRQVFTFVINRHFWRLVITFHICPYLSLLEAFPPTPVFTSGLPGPAVSGLNNKSILSSWEKPFLWKSIFAFSIYISTLKSLVGLEEDLFAGRNNPENIHHHYCSFICHPLHFCTDFVLLTYLSSSFLSK